MGHVGAKLGLTWANGGQVEAKLAQVAPTWANLGPSWANLGPSGAFLESFLSLLFFLEPFWALLLPSSGSLGHVFLRSWSRSGHFWGHLGISWAILGYLGPACGLSWTILGLRGVILGDLWANLRPSGAFLELCVVFFGQLGLQDGSEKVLPFKQTMAKLFWDSCLGSCLDYLLAFLDTIPCLVQFLFACSTFLMIRATRQNVSIIYIYNIIYIYL